MAKDYQAITQNIGQNMDKLEKSLPDFMKSFYGMSKLMKSKSALDPKTKEFVALGLSIAARCDGCIGFHMKTLVRLGATRAEVEEVLAAAVYMGGGPSLMYAAEAIDAFEQFSQG